VSNQKGGVGKTAVAINVAGNRNRAKERAQGKSEPSKPSKPDKPSETDKSDESSESSVKDERVGTYMHLPESQQKELSRLYNVLKAEYEYEYDTEFEKNRHFYPLVIELGLDSLADFRR